MALQKSVDADGKTILVRESESGPDILYPKWYSESGNSISYFFQSLGHDFTKGDRGWKYFYCVWTDDPNQSLNYEDFGFQANQVYTSRCGYTYPLSKKDRRRRLILPV